MKFFKKVMNFVKSKFSKPEAVVEEKTSKAPLNKDISQFVITRLNELIVNPTNIPEGLTKKQWRTALSLMVFSWDQAFREIELKSQKKQKVQKTRIILGFKLFVKYFKDIK